ncbi:MAG: hypothetical protein IJO53_07200 [Clostridia bacterium]|nr:hypothetical protein [Clostridia bacterium]MBQ9855969.1 hypothetical protein [Clostridia bacterium]
MMGKITVNAEVSVSDTTAARAVKILEWWIRDNFEDDTEPAKNFEELKEEIAERMFQKMEATDDD